MSVCVREREKRDVRRGERDGEGAEKEDRPFNNSQTPASFRIESVPKLNPRVLHTCLILRYSKTLCIITL